MAIHDLHRPMVNKIRMPLVLNLRSSRGFLVSGTFHSGHHLLVIRLVSLAKYNFPSYDACQLGLPPNVSMVLRPGHPFRGPSDQSFVPGDFGFLLIPRTSSSWHEYVYAGFRLHHSGSRIPPSSSACLPCAVMTILELGAQKCIHNRGAGR